MSTIQVLLNNALYKSTNDREFDPIQVGGNRINVALDLLTGLLDEYRNEVPFTQETTTDYAGLTNTDFNNVTHVDYILGSAKVPLKKRNQTRYNEESSVIGLRGVPEIFNFNELSKTIQVYPAPQDNSNDFIVYGYRDLGAIALTSSIPEGMPRFMRDFLEYELAFRLCNEYSIEWSQQKEAVREKLYRRLMDSKDIDLTPDNSVQFVRPTTVGAQWPEFYFINGGK